MIEEQLGRCVASWYPGATGVTGAARLSGGASQETWTFDIVHPGGNVGAIRVLECRQQWTVPNNILRTREVKIQKRWQVFLT